MSKTALITGAYRGLGFETARQLLAKGFEVIITARKATAGEKAADELRKTRDAVHFVAMNVEDNLSISAAVKEVSKRVDHLDVLINNAGVYPDGDKTPLQTERELMISTFNTNAASPMQVTLAFLPLLRKSELARVVNVSSGMGALTEMQPVATTYSISKTALNAVTRQLAGALKDEKILVNAVCPGWVRTEMGGKDAPRSPEEGAASILHTAMNVKDTGRFYRDGQPIDW